jgi:hypothetical protein
VSAVSTNGAEDEDVPLHLVDRAPCICGESGDALLLTRGGELRWEIVCLNLYCEEQGFQRLEDHGVCARGCGRVFSGCGAYEPIPDHTPLCDYCIRDRDGGAPTPWRRW